MKKKNYLRYVILFNQILEKKLNTTKKQQEKQKNKKRKMYSKLM
jgi:hypothetical protein